MPRYWPLSDFQTINRHYYLKILNEVNVLVWRQHWTFAFSYVGKFQFYGILLCQQDQWSWKLLMRRVNSTGLISQLIWTHYTKHLAAILFMRLTKLKWTSEMSGNLWSTSPSQVVLQHRLNLKDFASEQSQEQLSMTARKMVPITWLVTRRIIKSPKPKLFWGYLMKLRRHFWGNQNC